MRLVLLALLGFAPAWAGPVRVAAPAAPAALRAPGPLPLPRLELLPAEPAAVPAALRTLELRERGSGRNLLRALFASEEPKARAAAASLRRAAADTPSLGRELVELASGGEAERTAEPGSLQPPFIEAAPAATEARERPLARPTRRAVILYAPFGAGHEMAAQALRKAYERRGDAAELLDVTSLLPRWQARLAKRAYVLLQNRWPKGLELIYDAGEWLLRKPWFARLFRRFSGGRRLAEELVRRRPDAVLSTYLPSPAVDKARREGRLRARYGVVITDWRTHAGWLQGEPDRLYVAGGTDRPEGPLSDLMRRELAERGRDLAGVRELGIPVDPSLAGLRPEPAARLTVLVLGGGHGAGGLEAVLRGFRGAPGLRLVVAAGRNEPLRRRLEALAAELGLDAEVHGFVPHDRLLAVMAGADLVLTKPGGLTTAEAEALGRPMVLVGPAYAQEKGNAGAAVEAGAAVLAEGPGRAAEAALVLLREPERLREMGLRSRRLANLDAAARIVDDLDRD